MKTKQVSRNHEDMNMGKALVWTCAIIGLLSLTACPTTPPLPVVATPNQLCFPQARGIPEFPNPPNIDGTIGGVAPAADLGWSFSNRYVFGNGTSVPDAIVQSLRDDANNFLYLSFEINNDKTIDDKDAILLTFRPGGAATNDRRILIFPNNTGISGVSNIAPRLIQYWADSSIGGGSGWNTPATPSVNNPAWLVNNTKVAAVSDNATSHHWYVEMKIPISNAASTGQNTDTGINIPASGPFGFYFNILRMENNNGSLTAMEFPWPNDVPLTGAASKPYENTPDPANWGTGIRNNTACNGVNFDWYDIKIDHQGLGTPPPGEYEIALNQNVGVPNIFTVTPHNDSIDSNTNGYIPAPGVQATFKMRNYGVGTQYELVGTFGGNPLNPNPTSPGVTIPAAAGNVQGSALLSSVNSWNLNAAQQTAYAANPHQCILVELSSSANSNVVFKNKAAFSNMTFVTTTSPFKREASVTTGGYKLEQGQEALEFILNSFTYHTTISDRWLTTIDGLSDLGNGQFFARARPGEDIRLAAQITPPPQLSLPSNDVRVQPGSGGAESKALEIRVNPGDLITILSSGSVQVRKNDSGSISAGPNGFDSAAGSVQVGRAADGVSSAAQNREQKTYYDETGYLLPAQFQPSRHIGAVIGSWDNFKERTFLLGSMTSLKVPKNVGTLYIALNDTAEGYRQHSGRGFEVQVIATPFDKVYSYGNSLVSRDSSAEPFVMPVALNLPTWILCGQRKTNKTITIDNQTFQVVENAGCYGHALNRIGKPQTVGTVGTHGRTR
jgi:hypothetical protein